MPYFGFCLGHQLLADALGGTVGPAYAPEIGVFDIELTTAGRSSPLFAGLPQTMACLQWHSAEITRLPSGATTLASSPLCQHQAIQVGENAFSLQYHVEVGPNTVSEWGVVPEYREALEGSLGADGLHQFNRATAQHLSAFNHTARKLYDNWMSTVMVKAATS